MDSLVILDKEGIIHWASRTVFELLGYLPDELYGTEVFSLLSPIYGKKAVWLYTEVQKRPTRINEGLRQFLTRDGQTVPLYMTLNRLPGKSVPNFVLLHLHLFKPEDAGDFPFIQEKAEIEIALRKRSEREIVAELHDHINPTLVGAKLLLDFALQDPAQHSQHLKQASSVIKGLIQEIRNLSHTIAENADKDFELCEALDSVLENFRKGSSLRIVLRCDSRLEKVLSNKQKVHIVRIIQEQIVNINKHASANKVLISIQLTSDKVRLATKDNGKGFDPAKYHHGIGIRNMLSRVNELGGNMHINSKCGEGTSIRIVFPMNSQTAL